MEYKLVFQASDAGALFRVSGAGVGVGKNELVARGGSGGALALSRAPVGGSASPAPAPLPQPAPSPAPAALPPPALPPPALRAEPPRQPGAHIPATATAAAAAVDHAGTQLPARPVGAAGPRPPPPGPRAGADSPTPAPPAPAPSPLFPYQHAALPDYRHTNHEARTEAEARPDSAPLNLHASHHHPHPHPALPRTALMVPHSTAAASPLSSLPHRAPHSQPHPVMAGHDVRNGNATAVPAPTYSNRIASIVNHVNGSSHTAPTPTPSVQASVPSSLPNQSLPGRPLTPTTQSPRSYPTPPIGSSHVNSSISSSIHNHSISYQSPSLQKHSVQPVFNNRPPHLAPFSVSNHITNHSPPTITSQVFPQNQTLNHPISSQAPMNHSSHLPPSSTTSPLTVHTTSNNVRSSPTSLPSTLPNNLPNFSHSHKHSGLNLLPHPNPVTGSVSNVSHAIANHIDSSPPSTGAPTIPTVPSTNVNLLLPHSLDSRQSVASSNDVILPSRTESPAASTTLTTNGYLPPPTAYTGAAYPPLYAPYATTLQHSPYLPPAAASPRNLTDTVSIYLLYNDRSLSTRFTTPVA